MMKLDVKNGNDWQGFSRILEIMSFVDEIEDTAPDDIRETVQSFSELPGVATGMEFARHAEEGTIDPETAEKLLVFSSIFSHSTKSAIVDLALGQLEPEANQVEGRRRTEYKLRRS